MIRDYTCGCHLEPVDDKTESCDLCSEAANTFDGVGWRIRYCPVHAAAPDLLKTAKGLLDSDIDLVIEQYEYPAKIGVRTALQLLEAVIDKIP